MQIAHHGPRHDRHGRRRRHDRHRHGAVGHQGQGARRAGLEPARRQGARPDPHLRATPTRPRSRCASRSAASRPSSAAASPTRCARSPTLREAVGDEMDIMIDLHGPPWLTPARRGRRSRRALEPYHLLCVEDPIAPENLDGYQRIRDARQRAAGGRRAHGDDLRRARADRARARRRHPARHRPGRRHHADEEDRRHGGGASHHDGAAFRLARAGRRIRRAASAGGDPERRSSSSASRTTGTAARKTIAAASRCSRTAISRCRTRRASACDIDEDFVARAPEPRQCLGPGRRRVAAPTPPGTYDEHVYVQTRLAARALFRRHCPASAPSRKDEDTSRPSQPSGKAEQEEPQDHEDRPPARLHVARQGPAARRRRASTPTTA